MEDDAIGQYIKGQYLSAPEAAWQILAYDICCQNPSVSCLKLHEPNLNQHQYFLTAGNQNSPSQGSDLIQYFNHPLDSNFNTLHFIDYYESYILYPPPQTGHFPNEYWDVSSSLPNVPPQIVVQCQRKIIYHIQSV